MAVTAIAGANWGDEGTGKLTDRLAEDAHYVVRYQGGSNAGHTIVTERDSGWKTDITDARRFADLPESAKGYVRFVEERIGVPIPLVSNGSRRDQLPERAE